MRKPGAAQFRAAVRGVRVGHARHEEGQAHAAARLVSRVSVVIPVKDGERYLAELLDALAREARRRGARDRLRLDRPLARDRARRARRRAAGDPAARVRPRAHAQPRRRAHERRADLLPDAGRDARCPAGWTACAPASRWTSASARSSARTCRAPDTSPMIARELRAYFAGFAAPHGGPALHGAGRRAVPLERQRRLPARLLGAGPLPRRGLRRGPGVRRATCSRPAG